MMRFENPTLSEEFHKVFFTDTREDGSGVVAPCKTEDLTPAQVLWLVKFAKHVRGRCRSNKALLSYLQRSFPHLAFAEVDREWNGRTYQALVIALRIRPVGNVVIEEPEED